MITEQTRFKEIVKTPAGHDIIARVFYTIGIDENVLNGLIGNMKLKSLKLLSLGALDDSFIQSLLMLLNSDSEIADDRPCAIEKQWWKEAVFYEIYPRSFKDSNHDGIGDINGIIEKLDYLKDLGVDALWVCPFYDSPNADNGYDIRDYKQIMSEFGTMDDAQRLIDEIHKRDMHLIVDLVMNHTSDEHQWFKKFLNGEEQYKDYYINKSSKEIPNNWTSLFAGPAWHYYKEIDKWVMHLFAKKQIDLNWDNPAVRNEMFDVANYWLDKGADGFRLDVVSFISKAKDYPNGNEILGKLIGFTGVEHYFHGPHLDKYLKSFSEHCLKPHHAYTVGECPGAGLKMSRLITGDDRGELSQLFSFDHIDNPGHRRYDIYNLDLRKMIPELVRWQTQYSDHCWPTVFFDNHDNPRMVAKINKDPSTHSTIGKLLAMLLFTLKGTPYLYQGSELAMNNYPFESLDEYRDIEALQHYAAYIKKGNSESKGMAKLLAGTRDHARTPMCWDTSAYGGFSNVQPWINVNPDYPTVNAETETKDPDSCLNFHKQLIAFRRKHHALIYGSFRKLKTNRNIFAYERKDEKERFLIVINLTDRQQNNIPNEGTLLFSNIKNRTGKLQPYQADIYRL